jgi:hypothetical protein
MKILDAFLSLVLVSARRRSALTSIAMTVVAGGAALWIVWPVARVFETAQVADNPGWYLEMAANMSWCHRYPFVTSTVKANQTKVMLMHLSLECRLAKPAQRRCRRRHPGRQAAGTGRG